MHYRTRYPTPLTSCSSLGLLLLTFACSSPTTDEEKESANIQPEASTQDPAASGDAPASSTTYDLPVPSDSTSNTDAVADPPGASSAPSNEGACAGPQLDLTDLEASVGPFELIDGDWSGVGRMASQGSDIYLLGSAGLRVLRDGKAPAEVITAEVPEFALAGFSDGRNNFILDDTHAYFLVKAGIARAGLDGSPVEILFDGIAEDEMLTDLVIADDMLFFGWSGKGIHRMPLAGGEAPALVTDMLDYLGYTVAGDTLYAGADNGLYKMPAAGGTPTLVTGYTKHIFPYVGSISVLNDQLYWRDESTVLTCPLSDCSAPKELFGNAEHGLEIRGGRAYSIGESLQFGALEGTECGTPIFGSFPNELGTFTLTDDAAYVLIATYGFESVTTLYRVPLQ
jgi:hypothetical protein